MPKTLSIIIPAYNEERLIGVCLDAIAAQTVPPDEVIVVDNNSTDRTAEIAGSYPFVRVIQEKKQGIVFARNAGYNATECDIIGRIDADVTMPPGWVRRVRQFYDHPSHAERGLTGNGSPNNWRLQRLFGWLQGQIGFRMNRFIMGHYIFFGSNMALPRSVWLKVRDSVCLRNNIHEDVDLAIHVHRADCKVTYQESLRVSGRAGHAFANRKEFFDFLMMWPGTLRVHHIRRWPLGWLGAIILYVLSPVPAILEWFARLFGRKPLTPW